MVYIFPEERADTAAMLQESLHGITLGGVEKPCFYELRSELAEMGGAAAQVLEVEVATVLVADFPAVAEGDAATVTERDAMNLAGAVVWQQAYTVLRVTRDGPLADLLLQRA